MAGRVDIGCRSGGNGEEHRTGSGDWREAQLGTQETGAGVLACVVEGDSLPSSSVPSKTFPLNLLLGDLANPTCSLLEIQLKKLNY